ncbi:MAG: DUF2577 domain-containing protein [Paraclostridium sp.]
MSNLVSLIKKAAIEAIENSKPTHIQYGMVESSSPLKIRIDQKRLLGLNFLILGESIKQKSLQVGDKVILLRVQGGQEFVVIDRM